MEQIKTRLAALLTVKSIITVTLTIVFAILTLREKIAQDFMTIYTVVISFYFGTQAEKIAKNSGGDSNGV